MSKSVSNRWRLPALRGALVGMVAVPIGYLCLIISFGILGMVGFIAYHVLIPAIGVVALLRVPSPWTYVVLALINAAIGAGVFMSFSVRGPARGVARLVALALYAALVWASLVAFGNPFKR